MGGLGYRLMANYVVLVHATTRAQPFDYPQVSSVESCAAKQYTKEFHNGSENDEIPRHILPLPRLIDIFSNMSELDEYIVNPQNGDDGIAEDGVVRVFPFPQARHLS